MGCSLRCKTNDEYATIVSYYMTSPKLVPSCHVVWKDQGLYNYRVEKNQEVKAGYYTSFLCTPSGHF
jgi:hypothetical protein